jgi:hypothetical protein
MRSKTCAWILVVLSTLVVGVACSGGGGGGDDDGGGGDGTPTVCIGFSAAAGPAPSTVSASEGAGSICSTVIVEVSITDVNDVFGIEFDASFDPAVARYEGFSLSGSHLSPNGTGSDLFVDDTETTGNVHIAVNRVNPDLGIDFVGTQRVIQLTFARPSGAGDGDSAVLTFSDTKVRNDDTPPAEIPGITWSGGTLRNDS